MARGQDVARVDGGLVVGRWRAVAVPVLLDQELLDRLAPWPHHRQHVKLRPPPPAQQGGSRGLVIRTGLDPGRALLRDSGVTRI